MTFKIITLGCKLNSCESAAIAEGFLADGFGRAPEGEGADVYIINSCAVTGTAVAKVRHELSKCRREASEGVVVLCGCYPQSFPEEAALSSGADIVVGNAGKGKLAETVRAFMRDRVKTVKITPLGRVFDESCAAPDEDRTRAFIKAEDGCDRFCSYCIIPTARGRVRSLAPEKIAAQAAQCVGHGHKEIVLTGINLGCYGQELGLTLADAVRAVERSGVPRIRLSSLEPEMLTDGEIAKLKAVGTLCPHFHLSLQSGSDTVLKRMNRKYDTAAYRHVADKLREAFPTCSITTDVIVGFPEETDEEFLQTVDFVREIGFAKVHVFPYSMRKGTVAAVMKQVPPPVRADRAKMLTAAAKETELKFCDKQRGTVQTVLIEKPQSAQYSHGFTENYTPVRLYGAELARHTLVRAELFASRDGYCLGRVFGG
ncbi:MAG: tRNA (N(6)-L-threonylcarbamoyladenosine(37)-C(2))-methylthiotransferase MtaB [Lachnospiraceae bacterium]|nr:tRNA (N(6)-L-threonylcarbamoyladenosine(37)-C(2))-methylthiotransferase MtaB [Ruminococcus sp.]MCM1274807.1 tRNA (N(6)-L-threonylcarbamoyladenosine(37)-C(2))-methylthiotransferase MtaB [Lachnospiraceae bacterium]